MDKKIKSPPSDRNSKSTPVTTKVMRSAKTGQTVTIRGFNALKDKSPKIEKGVSLLKPIARQALKQRSSKRETA